MNSPAADGPRRTPLGNGQPRTTCLWLGRLPLPALHVRNSDPHAQLTAGHFHPNGNTSSATGQSQTGLNFHFVLSHLAAGTAVPAKTRTRHVGGTRLSYPDTKEPPTASRFLGSRLWFSTVATDSSTAFLPLSCPFPSIPDPATSGSTRNAKPLTGPAPALLENDGENS